MKDPGQNPLAAVIGYLLVKLRLELAEPGPRSRAGGGEHEIILLAGLVVSRRNDRERSDDGHDLGRERNCMRSMVLRHLTGDRPERATIIEPRQIAPAHHTGLVPPLASKHEYLDQSPACPTNLIGHPPNALQFVQTQS